MIKVVCWNVATMSDPWRELIEMDADVALLQEVGTVPEDVRDRVELSPHVPWLSHDPTTGQPHYDRWPMVVRLSDRVKVEWFRQIGPTWVAPECPGDVAVSGIGTIDAARVVPTTGPQPFIAASMYARWLDPHPTAVGDSIYSDASAPFSKGGRSSRPKRPAASRVWGRSATESRRLPMKSPSRL